MAGLLVFTGAAVALVVAYLVWAGASDARGQRLQAEKERRWAAAFGMAADTAPAESVAGPGRRIVAPVLGVAIGAGLVWWGVVGDRPAPAETPPAATTAAQYPGPWRDDARADIVRALARDNVRGCGRLAYRAHRDGGEFLVYCQGEGTAWRAYLVWAGTGRVMGPYAPDPSVPPPG